MPEDRDAWTALSSGSAGLCEGCIHPRLNLTRRGTAYLRCLRAEWDDRLPRYPRLPVLDCVGFEPADPAS